MKKMYKIHTKLARKSTIALALALLTLPVFQVQAAEPAAETVVDVLNRTMLRSNAERDAFLRLYLVERFFNENKVLDEGVLDNEKRQQLQDLIDSINSAKKSIDQNNGAVPATMFVRAMKLLEDAKINDDKQKGGE